MAALRKIMTIPPNMIKGSIIVEAFKSLLFLIDGP